MNAEYIDHMGDDLRIVDAARVSFNKESQLETFSAGSSNRSTHWQALSKADTKLIHYLATHGHWTPFAHPMITLRETVPIFVARQRFKHMVGFTYNEVSRRYVDDEPEFHVPTEWRSRPVGGIKQGSAGVHPANDHFRGQYAGFCEAAHSLYAAMIKDGIAPEQARMVLPQSMMTSYYVTGSLAAWARAYKQRIDPHAQQEIQDLAQQWGDILSPLFPVSWEALTQ